MGEAIVGELTGERLAMLPARLESFAAFGARAPGGKVLVPENAALSPYGSNPYIGYEGAPAPFLYRGLLPRGIAPLARVVRVGDQAWALDLLRAQGTIIAGDLRLAWEPGQASALDRSKIAEGLDVGNVVVERKTAEGWEDVVYSVNFAFAFHAFYPANAIVTD